MRLRFFAYLLFFVSWAFGLGVKADEELAALARQNIGKNPAHYSDDLLRVLYPNQPLVEVRALLNETWLERRYNFDPVAHISESPFQGQFVKVSENNFRLVRNQTGWPPPPERKAVFLFGGSTMFGYGVRDDQTIASYLQDALDEKFHGEYAVYNFGVAYDYGGQYRLRLERLLAQGLRPYAVITLHGVNESAFFWSDTPENFFVPPERSGYLWRQRLGQWASSMISLAQSRFPNTYQQAILGFDKMERTEKMIAAYGKRFNFFFLSILQPMPQLAAEKGKNPLFSENVWPFSYNDPLRAWFASYSTRMEGAIGSSFLAMHDFMGPGKIDYVDAFHYSPDMNRALAAALYSRLVALDNSRGQK